MSRRHRVLDGRRWARVRKLALHRAGYRSELSGRAGRLEVDHIVPLHRGGDPYALDNVQVLTRDEHIAKTRAENTRPDAERDAWRRLVAELTGTNG